MRSRAASACRASCSSTTPAGVAAGKALDIQQAGAVDGSHTRLDGTTADSRVVVGAAVCVVADRSGRTSSEWQGDEGLAMLTRLAPYARRRADRVRRTVAGELLLAAARESHIRRERLVGSAPEALVWRGEVRWWRWKRAVRQPRSDSPCSARRPAGSSCPGAKRRSAATPSSAC